MTTPNVERPSSSVDDQPEHTGGMVALIPTGEDAAKLAVDDGSSVDELHLTLAFLGDDVTGWDQELIDAVHQVVMKLTDPSVADDDHPVPEDEHDYRGPGQRGPLTLNIFAHSHFNPNGGPDGQEPCMVYQFSGGGDLDRVRDLHSEVCYEIKDAIGEVHFPEQHSPYQPHVTAGYDLAPGSLSYTGPVVFDRLRVVLADLVTDYPLGGGSMEDLTAALTRTKGGSVTSESREKAKKAGHAMPDGSFPIEDGSDLDNAVQSVGRASDTEAARRHIIKQAKRLRLESRVPDSWNADGTVTASAELDDGQRVALTAAVGAMVEKMGPVDAHGLAPQVFQAPESLAFVDTLIELPDADDALTAAADVRPPPAWYFDKPEGLPPGTGHYVDGDRVYGRLAEWNVPHIGMNGQKIYPPRSPSGYRWFHTKTARVLNADGQEERIKIGHITFSTGHAPKGLGGDHVAAAAHYDNSGYRGARVRMYEDEHGPIYAGATVPGLEGTKLVEFEESDTSGDWRAVMGGPLDLVAVSAVNVGGFPKVGLELAASGEPLALVASAKAWGNPAAVMDVDAIAAAVVSQMEKRTTARDKIDELLASLDDSEDRAIELIISMYGEDIEAAIAEYGDGLTADAMPVSRMPAQLQKSYVAGKVSQRIRWGVPGDFKRCVAQAKLHGMGHMADGACAMLHHKALGAWPGREHGGK